MLGNSFGSVFRGVGYHTFARITHTHSPPTLQRAVQHTREYVNITDVTGWRKKV